MNHEEPPVTFTPANEPYLGSAILLEFDNLIISSMEQNTRTAPLSFNMILTEHQVMASQVIAQALSITLSIRELIRQGYLFGGHVLLRPLIERSTILLYLDLHPEDIEKWKSGWHNREAPSLPKMLKAIRNKIGLEWLKNDEHLMNTMNSLIHAKPDSAFWNLILLQNNEIGHSTSKILNRPKLCDDLCADILPWLVLVQTMMKRYFPDS